MSPRGLAEEPDETRKGLPVVRHDRNPSTGTEDTAASAAGPAVGASGDVTDPATGPADTGSAATSSAGSESARNGSADTGSGGTGSGATGSARVESAASSSGAGSVGTNHGPDRTAHDHAARDHAARVAHDRTARDRSAPRDRAGRQKTAARPHERPAWLRPGTPTRPSFAPVIGPELPDDATVNLVLDLALRVGEVLMASGGGAADVTATVLAVTSSCGLPSCEVDVIFTSISICCQRGTDLAPVTTHRVVRSRALDYTRLTAVERLVGRITAGRITAADAAKELHTITEAPHPYPRWVATLAWALLATSVSVLIGGSPQVGIIAGVTTALIDRLGRLLNRRGLPFFFQQVIGGLVATSVTMLLMRFGLLPPGVAPSLVVAAALTVLLSGLSVVSAVQDAISGFNVTAAGRAMETVMMSAGLVAGVVIALNLAVHLGLPSTPLAAPLPQTALRLPVQVVAGAAAAAAFALASYGTRRALPVAAGAGALGAAAHSALALVGVNQIAANAVAAVLIGFAGGALSRRFRLPPLVVAVSGLTPLLPGLTSYQAMFQLAVERNPTGISTLAVAIASAFALAAGVVFGEFLAQPVRTGLGRMERRLSGPRLVGPLRPSRRRLD